MKTLNCLRSIQYVACALVVASAGSLRAQFTPITLTQSSYNRDLIVESNAASVITSLATMDQGCSGRNANTWYEQGFTGSTAGSGLLHPGTTFTSTNGPSHVFTFPPSYATNCVVMIDSVCANGSFLLNTPAAYTGLSFLASAGSGQTAVSYTLDFADGTTESGSSSFIVSDWFSNSGNNTGLNPVAFIAAGRYSIPAGFDTQAAIATNPVLYQIDVPIVNTTGMITNIALSYGGTGGGHAAIFAVSGSTGGTYNPIAVNTNSYNIQMIILPHAGVSVSNYTTASMQTGVTNTGATFFEQGFISQNGTLGLPNAGSTFVSQSAGDHTYTMAPSFTNNNAMLIQSNVLQGPLQMTLASPASYSGLSLLCAGSASNVTMRVIIQHADTSLNEARSVIVPDWTNNAALAAWVSGAAISLDFGTNLISAASSIPYNLYGLDIICNSNSPVTGLTVSWNKGLIGSHVAIFAVSGQQVGGGGGTQLSPFNITFQQRISPTQFRITWDSVSGHIYQVLSKTALIDNWVTNTAVFANGASTSYTDTVPANSTNKFYRVLGQP